MTTLENSVQAFLDFARKNPMLLVCSSVYYLLSVCLISVEWWSWLLVAAVYAVAICAAFSPFGEWLMRTLNHARRLESAEEKNFLRPLFKEVYGKAKNLFS